MTDPIQARYFLCRLLPPRSTFMLDMSASETALMGQHIAYWSGLLDRGVAVVFGPVADPKGGWGVGIVRASGEQQMEALRDGDPVMQTGSGFRYEILPMPRAMVRQGL